MLNACLCASAKLEFIRGVHQPTDTYAIALYTNDANLNTYTTAYTPEGEVRGRGYQRGGLDLEGYEAVLDGVTACLSWKRDPVWQNASISADGALIYNRSKGNRAIAVVLFGERVTSTNGPFRVPMPPATSAEAPIYLG